MNKPMLNTARIDEITSTITTYTNRLNNDDSPEKRAILLFTNSLDSDVARSVKNNSKLLEQKGASLTTILVHPGRFEKFQNFTNHVSPLLALQTQNNCLPPIRRPQNYDLRNCREHLVLGQSESWVGPRIKDISNDMDVGLSSSSGEVAMLHSMAFWNFWRRSSPLPKKHDIALNKLCDFETNAFVDKLKTGS